jgi:hypothetical protein
VSVGDRQLRIARQQRCEPDAEQPLLCHAVIVPEPGCVAVCRGGLRSLA